MNQCCSLPSRVGTESASSEIEPVPYDKLADPWTTAPSASHGWSPLHGPYGPAWVLIEPNGDGNHGVTTVAWPFQMEGRLCFHIEPAADFNEHTKQMAEWEFDTSDVDVFGDSFQDELEWAYIPEWAYSEGTVPCESHTAQPRTSGLGSSCSSGCCGSRCPTGIGLCQGAVQRHSDSDSPAVLAREPAYLAGLPTRRGPKCPIGTSAHHNWPCESSCRLLRLDMTRRIARSHPDLPDDPTDLQRRHHRATCALNPLRMRIYGHQNAWM